VKNFIYLAIGIIILSACRKDVTNTPVNLIMQPTWTPPSDICPKDTGKYYPPPPGGRESVYCEEMFSVPAPSPSNNDVFAYSVLKQIKSPDSVYYQTQIRVHNAGTGEDKLLVKDMDANGGLTYSKKGWVLFSRSDGSLYKIREDGTNLTRLNDLYGYDPSWSPSGEKFHSAANTGYIADENGNILSIDSSWGLQFQWADEDNVLTAYWAGPKSQQGLGLLNLKTNVFVKTFDLPHGPGFPNASYIFINGQILLWHFNNQLFLINLANNKTTLLRTLCYAYGPFRLSADHDYAYAERDFDYNYTKLQKKRLSEIVRINVNTGELEKIKMP
jgi:hypothetical protein